MLLIDPMQSFADNLERFSGRTALIAEEGETLSYAELAARADRFAVDLGDCRGPVFIEATNSIATVVAYLGALRSRRPAILASRGASEGDDRILRTFAPPLLYRLERSDWRLDRLREHGATTHPDLALLLSTSGSTGSPKLVRLSHENLTSNANAIIAYLGLDHTQRAITSLPFHYSYGLSVVNSHLAAGGSLVLTDLSVLEGRFWTLIEQHEVTGLAGVPHSYDLLEQIGFRDRAPQSLQILTQAGGRLSPERAIQYGHWAESRNIRFFMMYGQTEASPRMAYLPSELLAKHPDHIGVPIPGGAFRIVDEAGDECPTGEAGELIYTGPNVMMGYAEHIADLAQPQSSRELWTGDLAVRNADGLYRIVGRKARFAKLFGLRISLDDVEAELRQYGIQATAAAADDRIAMCINGGDTIRAVEILVKRYDLPSRGFSAYAAAEPPLLASGKIDYPAIVTAARTRQAPDRPGNLREGLSSILGRPVAAHDSFASLGGDSLSYVQAAMEIERLLGVLPEHWERMPLHELELQTGAAPRQTWWKGLDPEIAVRACAILAVVLSHIIPFAPPAPGGAVVLMMLAGYSLARFNSERLLQGDIRSVLGQFATRILLPYYLLYGLMVMLTKASHFSAAGLLFYSNFEKNVDKMAAYWFIHALWQCLLLFSVPFLFPKFRNFAREKPWLTAMLMVAVVVVGKYLGTLLWDPEVYEKHTPDAVLYLYVLGWALYHAHSAARKACLFALVAVTTAMDFGIANSHHIWLTAATGVILLVPRLKLPWPFNAAVAAVAAASFWIFLTHEFAIQLVRYELGLRDLVSPIIGAAIIGIATERFWNVARPELLRRFEKPPTYITAALRWRPGIPND